VTENYLRPIKRRPPTRIREKRKKHPKEKRTACSQRKYSYSLPGSPHETIKQKKLGTWGKGGGEKGSKTIDGEPTNPRGEKTPSKKKPITNGVLPRGIT